MAVYFILYNKHSTINDKLGLLSDLSQPSFNRENKYHRTPEEFRLFSRGNKNENPAGFRHFTKKKPYERLLASAMQDSRNESKYRYCYLFSHAKQQSVICELAPPRRALQVLEEKQD